MALGYDFWLWALNDSGLGTLGFVSLNAAQSPKP
jgi:hypothetical protein